MLKHNTSRNNNFNLLRHLAAFMVLYGHCAGPGDSESIHRVTKHRIELTSLGVSIFFVVSGYLVTQSLITTDNRLRFARKRWLRIWPALFVVTLAMCFVLGPAVTTLSTVDYFTNSQTWYFLFRNAVFLPVYSLPGVFNGEPVNATFWTIFFEVFCYLSLWIAGSKFLLKNKGKIVVVWLLLAVWIYFVPPVLPIPLWLHTYVKTLPGPVFLFFCGSVWLLFTYKFPPFKAIVYLPVLVLLIISILLDGPVARLVQTVSFVLFIIEWGRSKAVFHWPKWDISYGMYLIAWPVAMVLVHGHHAFRNSPAKLILATLAITIPLAFASWYGIERQALKRK